MKAEVALVELPEWIKSINDLEVNDIYNKYYKSCTSLLKNMEISAPKRTVLKTNISKKIENNITEQEQFYIAFSGLIKNEIPTEEEIEKCKQKIPTKNGIWIEEKSQYDILNMINELTNYKYQINCDNYLELKENQEKTEKNEYDVFIQMLINSDHTYILGKTGKMYFRDILTKEIAVDLYEDLDSYQIYNYVKDKNQTIIDITSNKKEHLNNKQIMNSLMDLLK